ncbi:MAG TPA: hypothetical protein VF908_06400, partial [Gemmatimonadaceae bacterium]
MISLAAATLALLVAATAGGQTPAPQLTHSVATPLTDSVKARPNTETKPADSAAAATKAAAALPKWFDELAVNAFVSTAYEYNSNRPTNGANSFRVFDFSDNSFNLDVAELVVQIAA